MARLVSLSLFPLFTVVCFVISLELAKPAIALPLSTNSRWVVDEKGHRVKLACVNWVAHLDPLVAEGLSKQPINAISKKIVAMGFNCVRLTWPIFLVTNDSMGSLTVRQSFEGLGLKDDLAGIQTNNPSIVDLPLLKAFQAVVANLGDNNVMVVLDNHVSKPGWCCGNDDGNGFFGDKFFSPDLWITGLTKMATMFKGVANVVGMSLRNELRGGRENVDDWYRYMQRGAEAVHAANPDVLVILSGLNYATDLSFIRNRPVNLTFTGKQVFEAHWYSFFGGAWSSDNPKKVCDQVVSDMKQKSVFVLDQGFPLFLSEYGIDERGTNLNDHRFLDCFLGVAAELDFDWALWSLVGSYYLREGIPGVIENFGVLNENWVDIRNQTYLQRISAIQRPVKGSVLFETTPDRVILHRTGRKWPRRG